jgi:hypothetical protein
MLSLEMCREVLGEDAPEDESELRNLRDILYAFGHLGVDLFSAMAGDSPGEEEREGCK